MVANGTVYMSSEHDVTESYSVVHEKTSSCSLDIFTSYV